MLRYLFVALLAFAACKKEKKEAPSPSVPVYEFDYTIKKWENIPLHYHIYRSYNDFMNSTNPVLSAYGDTVIHFSNFPFTDSIFYCDIYSDDYRATNWGNGRPSPLTRRNMLTFLQFVSSQRLEDYIQDTRGMRQLINGNSPSTQWHAVDAFNNTYVSVWNVLDEVERHHVLTIDKNGRFNIAFNELGTPVIDTGYFTAEMNSAQMSSPYLRMEGRTREWRLLNINHPQSTIEKKDTAILYDAHYFWLMVKEK